MGLLDKLVALLRRILGVLPNPVAEFLWFPVLVTVVVVVAILVVRRFLPVLGRVGAGLLRLVLGVVAAMLLVPDLILATVFRVVSLRPPGAVFGYGDAVMSGAISITAGAEKASAMAARIARVNVFAVLLGCALLIGAWNNTTCDRVASAQACVRPVASWWAHLHGRPAGSVDIPTSPTPKPSSGQPKP